MALGASGTVVIAIRRIYQTKRPDGNARARRGSFRLMCDGICL